MIIKSRIMKDGRKRRFFYSACLLKDIGCGAIKPRWVRMGFSGNCRSCCPRFKGGTVNPNGYVMLSVAGKRILEHRYIMKIMLGRELRKGETVSIIGMVSDLIIEREI